MVHSPPSPPYPSLARDSADLVLRSGVLSLHELTVNLCGCRKQEVRIPQMRA